MLYVPILYSRLPGARDVARLFAAEGDDHLAVHASSGVAAAWGFHHYLKVFRITQVPPSDPKNC